MTTNTSEKENRNDKVGAEEKAKFSTNNQLIQVREKSLKNLKANMNTIHNKIEDTEQMIKTSFLSNISHEIKTPLNSILSATILLQQKSLDSETAKLVETIHHSGQYLFTLLNNILDYYKLISHQLNLDHINFDLKNELEEIYTIFEQKGKEKNIKMKMDIGKNVPDFLIGDPTRLKQVLANLLENAIKFTPSPGNIIIKVSSLSFHNGLNEISFSVRDSGIGIGEKDKNDIWKTFHMADMSLTRENSGTGLGLPLSHQLCRLLGGKMYFESKKGTGSTFTFTVKMEEGKQPKHNEHKGLKIKDILLVEDNLINQKLTQKILVNKGFHVEVADNGKMAVEKFRTNHFDLIFMDIQMPVMDGLEATRQIRKIEIARGIRQEKVKIVALTANSQQQDKESCLAAGMDDYINKPFNMKKIPLIMSNLQSHQS